MLPDKVVLILIDTDEADNTSLLVIIKGLSIDIKSRNRIPYKNAFVDDVLLP